MSQRRKRITIALLVLLVIAAGWFVLRKPGRITSTITAIVAALTLLNVRGVRLSTLFNDGFTIAKLTPLLLFVVIGLFFIEPANVSFASPPGIESFSAAVLLLAWWGMRQPKAEQTGRVAGRPEVVSRGFVDMDESDELIERTRDCVLRSLAGADHIVEPGAVSWSKQVPSTSWKGFQIVRLASPTFSIRN